MMRLFWSSRSPFARKAMVVAHERGLAGRIERVPVSVSQLGAPADLLAVNPLGQIPTLVLESGVALFDSAVICEALAGAGEGPELLPASGARRLAVLRRQAEADGVMEALVRRLGEQRRDDQRSRDLQAAYAAKVARVLDRWEAEIGEADVDLGGIAAAVALAYADFRFKADEWRENRPVLTAWHAKFQMRFSMRATEFADDAGRS